MAIDVTMRQKSFPLALAVIPELKVTCEFMIIFLRCSSHCKMPPSVFKNLIESIQQVDDDLKSKKLYQVELSCRLFLSNLLEWARGVCFLG